MVFSKRFPRTDSKGYTVWEEVTLTNQEEKDIENLSTKENRGLFKRCLEDAKKMMTEENLKDFQTDRVSIAIALFEKRASHTIYWKENLCKDKFDKKFQSSGTE